MTQLLYMHKALHRIPRCACLFVEIVHYQQEPTAEEPRSSMRSSTGFLHAYQVRTDPLGNMLIGALICKHDKAIMHLKTVALKY